MLTQVIEEGSMVALCHISSDFCVGGSLPEATTSVAEYLERQAVREPCSPFSDSSPDRPWWVIIMRA